MTRQTPETGRSASLDHTDAPPRHSLKYLTLINHCFLSFSPDPLDNINKLVTLCGETMGAAAVIYNRLENGLLHALGQWNTAPDFKAVDKAEGHICHDVIKKGSDQLVMIRDLHKTPYAKTDRYVDLYHLKTYIGMAVKFFGHYEGSLCVVFQEDYTLSPGEETFIGIIASAIGVEEKRRSSKEALKESEGRFRAIFENAVDCIYLKDSDLNYTMVNPHMEKMLQTPAEQFIGKSDAELFGGQFQVGSEKIDARVLNGEILQEEITCPLADKDRIFQLYRVPIYNTDGSISGLCGISRDVTDDRQMADHLRHIHKMEAIGTLTGGIAHDFNNILGIILGNTELALDDIEEWKPTHSNVEEIKTAALRAADIVKRLLSFGQRSSSQELVPVDINNTILEALKFLRSSIPKTIAIQTHIPKTSCVMLGNKPQLNQILMNLFVNAFQEMEQTGGTIDIRVDTVVLNKDTVLQYPGLPHGTYARIAVSDTGGGMDPHVVDRIFDPYFTTRETGKGSGMGLSVVHGLVENHSGAIFAASEKGRGSTFKILFPSIEETLEKNHTDPSGKIQTGTESILFVDDDSAIVKMSQQILSRLGYQVKTMMNPLKALEAFRSDPDQYDLVITDMTMPQMTGATLALALKKIKKDIPIIICTGHSSLMDEKKAKQIGISAYAMKPIEKKDIADIIRNVLDHT